MCVCVVKLVENWPKLFQIVKTVPQIFALLNFIDRELSMIPFDCFVCSVDSRTKSIITYATDEQCKETMN